jgi:hypothetical protein
MKSIMKISNLISSLVFLALTAGCLFAQTTTPPFVLAYQARNVLYITTNGNDATSLRGHSELPFATLTNALAHAQLGDKIAYGVGVFSNAPLSVIGVPSGLRNLYIEGLGTNNTFIYGGTLLLTDSNTIGRLTFVSDVQGVGLAGRCFIHDATIKGELTTVFGGSLSGWNILTNCTFICTSNGVTTSGSNYFMNCAILKTNNASSVSSALIKIGNGNGLYWSGGMIKSTTNSTGDGTNNFAIFSAAGGSAKSIQVQNVTITMPGVDSLSGWHIYGGGAPATNYASNVTLDLSRVNGAAITPGGYSGFSPVASMAPRFSPSWNGGNTNKPPVLLVPPN